MPLATLELFLFHPPDSRLRSRLFIRPFEEEREKLTVSIKTSQVRITEGLITMEYPAYSVSPFLIFFNMGCVAMHELIS